MNYLHCALPSTTKRRLDGVKRLRVLMKSSRVFSLPLVLVIAWLCALLGALPCAAQGRPKTVALIVGVKNEKAPLRYTVRDAELMRRTLPDDDPNVKMMLSEVGEAPNKRALLDNIEAMAARGGAGSHMRRAKKRWVERARMPVPAR